MNVAPITVGPSPPRTRFSDSSTRTRRRACCRAVRVGGSQLRDHHELPKHFGRCRRNLRYWLPAVGALAYATPDEPERVKYPWLYCKVTTSPILATAVDAGELASRIVTRVQVRSRRCDLSSATVESCPSSAASRSSLWVRWCSGRCARGSQCRRPRVGAADARGCGQGHPQDRVLLPATNQLLSGFAPLKPFGEVVT